jgi:hypothetical protein
MYRAGYPGVWEEGGCHEEGFGASLEEDLVVMVMCVYYITVVMMYERGGLDDGV